MRYFLILSVLLAGLVVGGFKASPYVMDWWVDGACPEDVADPECFGRMRWMGHVWTARGELDRGGLWYLRGARAGDVEAMFHLAWVYEELVIDHYQEQARVFSGDKVEDPPAEILTAQLRDVTPDKKESFLEAAAAWYRKSAQAGFAPSMNNLGTLYAIGFRGRADHAIALDWYVKAARTGNPIGARNAMGAYGMGHGTPRDLDRSAKWSVWQPRDGITADLKAPTLRRTRLIGVPYRTDEDDDIMRRAAKEGRAIELTIQPRTRRDVVLSDSGTGSQFPIETR